MIGNKITQREVPSPPQDPFQSQEDIGLFTFYKLQETNSPLLFPHSPVSVSSRVAPQPRKQRSKTESRKEPNRRGTQPAKKVVEDLENQNNKLIKAKASQVLKCRLQFISENSLDTQGTRKNAAKYQNLPRPRLKTESHTSQQSQKPQERVEKQSVHLIRIKEVSSEEVRQLFKPKRQAISRIMSSSLCNQELNAESHQQSPRKGILPSMEYRFRESGSDKVEVSKVIRNMRRKEETEKGRDGLRHEQQSFLSYIYRQKNIISEHFCKLKHRKKIEQIVATMESRQKHLKGLRVGNSPTALPATYRWRPHSPSNQFE